MTLMLRVNNRVKQIKLIFTSYQLQHANVYFVWINEGNLEGKTHLVEVEVSVDVNHLLLFSILTAVNIFSWI